jgi:hypothetical protein
MTSLDTEFLKKLRKEKYQYGIQMAPQMDREMRVKEIPTLRKKLRKIFCKFLKWVTNDK